VASNGAPIRSGSAYRPWKYGKETDPTFTGRTMKTQNTINIESLRRNLAVAAERMKIPMNRACQKIKTKIGRGASSHPRTPIA
jgi:hypothetical protein